MHQIRFSMSLRLFVSAYVSKMEFDSIRVTDSLTAASRHAKHVGYNNDYINKC